METTEFLLADGEHFVYRCKKCGKLHQFEADGPDENGWEYCPCCGRHIAAIKD